MLNANSYSAAIPSKRDENTPVAGAHRGEEPALGRIRLDAKTSLGRAAQVVGALRYIGDNDWLVKAF